MYMYIEYYEWKQFEAADALSFYYYFICLKCYVDLPKIVIHSFIYLLQVLREVASAS